MENLVTVILPFYNASQTLQGALDSVKNQTFKNWELLAIDDGSTDGSWEIVQAAADMDRRVRLVRLGANSGRAAVPRNKGLSLARGDFIAFLDADDFWYQEKLERQLKVMVDGQHSFSFHSFRREFVEDGSYFDEIAPETVAYKQLLRANPICCSTVMVARDFIEDVRFREDVRLHEDYIMWLELLRKGAIATGLQPVLARYHQAEGSFSGNKWKAAKQQWQILRKYEKLSIWKAFACYSVYAVTGLWKHKFRKYFTRS